MRAQRLWQRCTRVLGILCIFVLSGAGGQPPATKPARSSNPPSGRRLGATQATQPLLYATARRILKQIVEKESKQDATCWTTVRMMEHFYGRRPLSEAASFLKIEVSKVLIYRVWRYASSLSPRSTLSRRDINAALPSTFLSHLAVLERKSATRRPEHLRLKHYHRVTENWRLLLAIAMESLAGKGLFRRGWVDVKPLSVSGMRRLGQVSTVLTLRLLEVTNEVAKKHRHHVTQFSDIRLAYKAVLKELRNKGLEQTQGRFQIRAPVPSSKTGSRLVRQLTLLNMNQKIRALRSWNKGVWKGKSSKKQMLFLLNKLSKIKLDEAALNLLLESIRIGLSTIAQGVRQPTTVSMAALPSAKEAVRPENFEGVKTESLLTTQFIMEQLSVLFAHQTLVNGDVELVYATGSLKKPVFTRKSMTAPYLDAIRDITIHWWILRSLWNKLPQAKPLSPFAAEVLSERVSEFVGFALHALNDMYGKMKFKRVSALEMKLFLYRLATMRFIKTVPPHFRWGKKALAKKNALMMQYKKGIFGPALTKGFRGPCPAVKAHLYKGKYAFIRRTNHRYVSRAKNSLVDPNPALGHVASSQKDNRYPGLLIYSGSSVSTVDYDNDGKVDLFFTGEGCNRLYRNLGSYRFKDVTEEVGIHDPLYDTRQALFVDINNDGLLDLFLMHAVHPSRLYIQKAKGRFVDATQQSGIRTTIGANAAIFFDYDNDGKLDLFVGYFGAEHYSHGQLPSVDGRNGRPNQLWRNLGKGRFQNVTAASKMGSKGWVMALAAVDFNQDGKLDLFVANDFGRDELFLNEGNGRFRDVAEEWGLNDRTNGMNASLTDFNADGRWDMYVSVIEMFSKEIGFVLPRGKDIIKIDEHIIRSAFSLAGNKFYVSDKTRPNFYLSKAQVHFEPGNLGWSWSGVFFDLDNDGDEDFYLVNGMTPGSQAGFQLNQLFVREQQRFYLFPRPTSVHYRSNSRSAVAADLTNTGRMDLVLNDYLTGPRVFPNVHKTKNAWLKVRLRGVKTNRFGVGATIRLFVKGLPPQMRMISAGTNYLSQQSFVATFGLGQAKHADSITVTWPNGKKQKVKGPFAAKTIVTVRESR